MMSLDPNSVVAEQIRWQLAEEQISAIVRRCKIEFYQDDNYGNLVFQSLIDQAGGMDHHLMVSGLMCSHWRGIKKGTITFVATRH